MIIRVPLWEFYQMRGQCTQAITSNRFPLHPHALLMVCDAATPCAQATDRQTAYRTADEIAADEATNALAGACHKAVQEGVVTYPELSARFGEIQVRAKLA